MGQCLSDNCFCPCTQLTKPSIPPQHHQSLVMQKRVLEFTYDILCNKHDPKPGPHLLGVADSSAGWRCVVCGLFETAQDFCIRVNSLHHVQFQIPLCDKCRLYSVVPNCIYSPNQTTFRAFYQLPIVCDLLKIHAIYAKRQNMNTLPELMMAL